MLQEWPAGVRTLRLFLSPEGEVEDDHADHEEHGEGDERAAPSSPASNPRPQAGMGKCDHAGEEWTQSLDGSHGAFLLQPQANFTLPAAFRRLLFTHQNLANVIGRSTSRDRSVPSEGTTIVGWAQPWAAKSVSFGRLATINSSAFDGIRIPLSVRFRNR